MHKLRTPAFIVSKREHTARCRMVKILVCGDVEGRYAETFKRVAKLDKKAGPFDALFCVGTFYGDDRSCLLYTSPSPLDRQKSRMPSSA